MKNSPSVRRLTDLAKGDVVRTPLGREVTVKGFSGDRVLLVYGDGDEVMLLPHHLEIVHKAAPPTFPTHFFQGSIKRAMAQ